jgi:acyl-homoserine lactone synthase
VLGDKYEIDQFDDVHARYLILSEDGRHLASARLLPTTREGILSGLYPMLCEGPPPASPDVFEITRFCLDRSLNACERRAVRNTLVACLATYALGEKIGAYCAVADPAWYRQIEQFGWDCRPLGPPRRIFGEELVAMRIEITGETPALLARAGIVSSSTEPGASRHVA